MPKECRNLGDRIRFLAYPMSKLDPIASRVYDIHERGTRSPARRRAWPPGIPNTTSDSAWSAMKRQKAVPRAEPRQGLPFRLRPQTGRAEMGNGHGRIGSPRAGLQSPALRPGLERAQVHRPPIQKDHRYHPRRPSDRPGRRQIVNQPFPPPASQSGHRIGLAPLASHSAKNVAADSLQTQTRRHGRGTRHDHRLVDKHFSHRVMPPGLTDVAAVAGGGRRVTSGRRSFGVRQFQHQLRIVAGRKRNSEWFSGRSGGANSQLF